jgi:hypothetical protein
MGADGLDELLADPVQRVEARERVLEDHADALAAHPSHLVRRQIVDAGSRQPDFAARDPARRIDQPDHGGAGHRLAGARLANNAKHLALGDVERDAVDRFQDRTARDELDAQVTDGEYGFSHGRRYNVGALTGVKE